jgi:hypothetical protein
MYVIPLFCLWNNEIKTSVVRTTIDHSMDSSWFFLYACQIHVCNSPQLSRFYKMSNHFLFLDYWWWQWVIAIVDACSCWMCKNRLKFYGWDLDQKLLRMTRSLSDKFWRMWISTVPNHFILLFMGTFYAFSLKVRNIKTTSGTSRGKFSYSMFGINFNFFVNSSYWDLSITWCRQ